MIVTILEDDSRRQEAMREYLRLQHPTWDVVFFDNAPEMLDWLRVNLSNVGLLCLDHDLGPNRQRAGEMFDPGTGRDVANFLATRAPQCTVIVHTSNPVAAPGMLLELEAAGWCVRRVIPYEDLQWIGSSWAERVEECLHGEG